MDYRREQAELSLLIVVIFIIGGLAIHFINVRDMKAGHMEQTTATVKDLAFIGRTGTPAMILETAKQQYIKVAFDTSTQMYECANAGDTLSLREHYGKSGTLRKVVIQCKRWFYPYHDFLYLDLLGE